jgi:uncharacterized protein (TIGR03435 family)
MNAGGFIAMKGQTGGPGTKDPGRIHYPMTTLKTLIMSAYDVKGFQITGPSWLDSDRFDVEATMPPETTKEQLCQMLQNLLADRFQLAVHTETKELPIYSLVVGKSGPKMKESVVAVVPADAPPPPLPSPHQFKTGPDGTINISSIAGGRPGMFTMMMPNRAQLMAQQQTMKDLASRLSTVMNRPVLDNTELSAKYDFKLTYSPEGLNSGMPFASVGGPSATAPEGDPQPDLFHALPEQLGLKLESKKGPVIIIVIDHLEKTPTAN